MPTLESVSTMKVPNPYHNHPKREDLYWIPEGISNIHYIYRGRLKGFGQVE